MSLAYSGFLEAARIRDGLVVASWGLYLAIVAKSPESQTTVVPVALSWSSEDVMMLEGVDEVFWNSECPGLIFCRSFGN